MSRLWRRAVTTPKLAEESANALRLMRQRHPGEFTRQQLRARARIDCFRAVNEQYGPEPRKNRRKMALALARQQWRET
jgi:hypothetical protein